MKILSYLLLFHHEKPTKATYTPLVMSRQTLTIIIVILLVVIGVLLYNNTYIRRLIIFPATPTPTPTPVIIKVTPTPISTSITPQATQIEKPTPTLIPTKSPSQTPAY